MGFIQNTRYKYANNVTGSVKARYQYWPVGPSTWLIRRDRGDAGWQHSSPLVERQHTRVKIDVSHIVETEEMQIHSTRLRCWVPVTGYVLVPVTKVPYGPRETANSRDWWLIVVTVIVWCLLRILHVLRRTWNRRVSLNRDRGDACLQHDSPMLTWCNG
jgi:hypothetical protein